MLFESFYLFQFITEEANYYYFILSIIDNQSYIKEILLQDWSYYTSIFLYLIIFLFFIKINIYYFASYSFFSSFSTSVNSLNSTNQIINENWGSNEKMDPFFLTGFTDAVRFLFQ
jgi:hypothetical protein